MFLRRGLFLSSIFGSPVLLILFAIRTCVSLAIETSKVQSRREVVSTLLRVATQEKSHELADTQLFKSLGNSFRSSHLELLDWRSVLSVP
jgi:hypothetical protein